MIALLVLQLSAAASGNGELTPFAIRGFVKPVFSAVVRDTALPAQRVQVGIRSSRAGLTFAGQPLPQWRYKAFFVLGGDTFPALVSVRPVDANNDGSVDRIQTSARQAIGDVVRETSVTWVPVEGAGLRVGRMPVPLTSAAQSADVALLFNERAGPNQLFLADDDLGGLVEFGEDAPAQVRAGVFNGTGTGSNGGQRGILYLGRIDVQVVGESGHDEVNPERSGPRVGFGGGLIWHPYRTFDGAGFPRMRVNDFRGSVSVRLGLGGWSLDVEGLHRLQVDALSARPIVASGAYAQSAWRLPVGVEPIVRVGWAVEDRSFDPRTTIWTEGGLNFYPAIANADSSKRANVRINVAYQGEHRVTEGESAHAAEAAVVVAFP